MPLSTPVKRRKLLPSPKNYPNISVTYWSNTESTQSSDVFSSTESTQSSNVLSSNESTWSNDVCSFTKSTQSCDITNEMTKIANPKNDNSTCDKEDCFDINGSSSSRQKMSETREVETKSPVAVKMPSEVELEEFFTAAEKQINKQFRNKYNFDVAKEMPLQGRYEWVKINP